MDDLEILIESIYSNCKTENEIFKTQVNIMKKVKILKDKRTNELKSGVI